MDSLKMLALMVNFELVEYITPPILAELLKNLQFWISILAKDEKMIPPVPWLEQFQNCDLKMLRIPPVEITQSAENRVEILKAIKFVKVKEFPYLDSRSAPNVPDFILAIIMFCINTVLFEMQSRIPFCKKYILEKFD